MTAERTPPMTSANKATLLAANAAISVLDIEGFLQHCTDDIEWNAIGDTVISGKAALRQWMKANYQEPPEFTVIELVAEDDMVVAVGTIVTTDTDGRRTTRLYSYVWRFRDGRMATLRAFVVDPGSAA